MNDHSVIIARIDGSLAAIGRLREQADRIAAMAKTIVQRLQAGGTLYTTSMAADKDK